MNKLNSLLEKFREGELSPDEARELTSLIKFGDDNAEVKDLMTEAWVSSEKPAVGIPSERMLIRLRSLTRETENRRVREIFGTRLIRIRPLYRYAVLVIITAGITWAVQSLFSENIKCLPAVSYEDQYNEVSVSYGSKSRIVLPDGSVVNLNSGSVLHYPASFDQRERKVFIEGEAFFDVKRNSKVPFYVNTPEITIKVLGTSFNIKSYSDDDFVETTLVSGTIEIYANQEVNTNASRILVLKPNQQVIFEKQTGQLAVSRANEEKENHKLKPIKSLLIQQKIDVGPIISWKDNRLIFRDESFADLSRKLERWYDVEIEIQDEELAGALFSGIFVRETIEQALNAMKLATPFEYRMNKNRIIITR